MGGSALGEGALITTEGSRVVGGVVGASTGMAKRSLTGVGLTAACFGSGSGLVMEMGEVEAGIVVVGLLAVDPVAGAEINGGTDEVALETGAGEVGSVRRIDVVVLETRSVGAGADGGTAGIDLAVVGDAGAGGVGVGNSGETGLGVTVCDREKTSRFKSPDGTSNSPGSRVFHPTGVVVTSGTSAKIESMEGPSPGIVGLSLIGGYFPGMVSNRVGPSDKPTPTAGGFASRFTGRGDGVNCFGSGATTIVVEGTSGGGSLDCGGVPMGEP